MVSLHQGLRSSNRSTCCGHQLWRPHRTTFAHVGNGRKHMSVSLGLELNTRLWHLTFYALHLFLSTTTIHFLRPQRYFYSDRPLPFCRSPRYVRKELQHCLAHTPLPHVYRTCTWLTLAVSHHLLGGFWLWSSSPTVVQRHTSRRGLETYPSVPPLSGARQSIG